MGWWDWPLSSRDGSGDYERVPADDPDDAPADRPHVHHIIPDPEPDRTPSPEDVSGSSEFTSYHSAD
jgi:hypothetical protein